MSLRISGGRRLQSPPGNIARPTSSRVRLAVMNLLAPELPGCAWLDLCSGSGVMACEVLHRGAHRVVAVEQDRRIAAVARANLDAIGLGLAQAVDQTVDQAAAPAPRWEVHCREVVRWLAQPQSGDVESSVAEHPQTGHQQAGHQQTGDQRAGGFDLIYADPPYAAGLYAGIAAGVASGSWLKPTGTLVWECASSDLPTIPEGWELRDERRYGSTSLVLLQLA